MASSDKDIIGEILSHEDDHRRDDIIRGAEILYYYRPKITLDLRYKQQLRSTLTSYTSEVQKLKKNSFFFSIFSWIRIGGPVMAAFFIVLFFGKVFFTSTILSGPNQLHNPQDMPMTPSIDTPKEGEKNTILEEIHHDMHGSDHEKTRQNQEKITPHVSNENQMIQSSSVGESGENLPLESQSYDMIEMTESLPMPMMMRAMVPAYILPDYPTYMSIYMKESGSFTPEERESFSGVGISRFSVRTEQNRQILQTRIEKKLGDDITVSEGSIQYRELSKRGKGNMERRYLIPVISYILPSGDEITIPIVPGYE